MELSQLHRHSIALVSSVKGRSSNKITAIPVEMRLDNNEEVASSPQVTTATFQTFGGKETIVMQSDNSVPATWLKLNTNRVTAPDVRRNDLVTLYRLGNTEQYFWVDHSELGHKRLETAVYAWSADPNKPMADDLSNAYMFQVSSHDGNITLTTSNANGEPFTYVIQLNTKNGLFTCQDNVGNEIFLDSANTHVGMTNAAKTKMHLDKKNFIVYAPNDVKMTAENQMVLKCKDYILEALNSIKMETKTHNMIANTITSKADSIMMKADSVVSDAPQTTCTGMLSAAGIVVGGGAVGVSAESASKGSGNCEVSGELICDTLTAETASIKNMTVDTGHIKNFTHGGGKCC